MEKQKDKSQNVKYKEKDLEGAQEETFTDEEEKQKEEKRPPIPNAVVVRRSILFLANKVVFFELAYTLLLIVGFLPLFIFSLPSGISSALYFIFSLVLFVLGIAKIGLFLWLVKKWKGEYYEIYPKQLIHVTSSDEKSYSIKDLERVEVHQGRVGKYLNYGDLTVYIPSLMEEEEGNGAFVMYEIPNPQKYADILRNFANPLGNDVNRESPDT